MMSWAPRPKSTQIIHLVYRLCLPSVWPMECGAPFIWVRRVFYYVVKSHSRWKYSIGPRSRFYCRSDGVEYTRRILRMNFISINISSYIHQTDKSWGSTPDQGKIVLEERDRQEKWCDRRVGMMPSIRTGLLQCETPGCTGEEGDPGPSVPD